MRGHIAKGCRRGVRPADKDSRLTRHFDNAIFDPGFTVHFCPDKWHS